MRRAQRADRFRTVGKKLWSLAELIASDEDSLVCDLAEYYGVLHYRALPARLAASLAAGLPKRSRSRLRLAGEQLPDETQLLAAAVDALQRIEWRLIGCPGGRPPRSILAALTGAERESAGGVQGFDDPQEFEAALAALKGEDENGRRD